MISFLSNFIAHYLFKNQMPLNDRVVSIIMAILLAISNRVMHSYIPKLVTVSSLTLFVIAMFIIISKIKERRCFYEKGNKKILNLGARLSEKIAVKSCGTTSILDTYQPKIPEAVRKLAEKNKNK